MRIRIITAVPTAEKKKRVCAYARVSTDSRRQEESLENQTATYERLIRSNPEYAFAGVYADEGISATNTKKREEFNRMIADCRDGKIDMIITKSISRFARNTLDCLNYVRELKELGVGILFEKENINTLDAKGGVLLTILSSLAQDESRSISENSTWGIRRRFETGKHKMSTKRFLGYDSDDKGKLIVNSRQAKIVVRLFQGRVSRNCDAGVMVFQEMVTSYEIGVKLCFRGIHFCATGCGTNSLPNRSNVF